MFKTEVCDLFGIEYPIILGGMLWVGGAELTAAVSEAGGLGLLGAGGMGADQIAREIETIKQKTRKPFGVNVPLQRPDAQTMIEAALEAGALVISTSAGNPKRFTSTIKARGAKVMHVVSNVTFAQKSQEAGVDAVVVEGFEAGGHNGPDELTTMTLTPQCARAVDIPVIAAGGISDGRGLVAALALGAKGVQIGTRFVATWESAAHADYKQAIVDLPDNGTTITGRTTIGPTRSIKNKLTDMIHAAELENTPPQQLFEMIGEGRSARAGIEGDMEEGSAYCGQIGGMVDEIQSAGEVIRDVISMAVEVIESMGSLVNPHY